METVYGRYGRMEIIDRWDTGNVRCEMEMGGRMTQH